MTSGKYFSIQGPETGITVDTAWNNPGTDIPVNEKRQAAAYPQQPDDDDMIYPDNHLDDDDRCFLFPEPNTD